MMIVMAMVTTAAVVAVLTAIVTPVLTAGVTAISEVVGVAVALPGTSTRSKVDARVDLAFVTRVANKYANHTHHFRKKNSENPAMKKPEGV